MKVWHDDLRAPPEPGWQWAKTNAKAQDFLTHQAVPTISLDYDMTNEKGLTLAQWMAATKHLPDKIIIHSQNEAGANAMATVLRTAGADPVLKPFAGRYAPAWVIAKREAMAKVKAA